MARESIEQEKNSQVDEINDTPTEKQIEFGDAVKITGGDHAGKTGVAKIREGGGWIVALDGEGDPVRKKVKAEHLEIDPTPKSPPQSIGEGTSGRNGRAIDPTRPPADFSGKATRTGGIDEDALEEEAEDVVLEQQLFKYRQEIEQLQAEVKSLKEQRAHLVGEIDQLQRNPTPSPSPLHGEGGGIASGSRTAAAQKWAVQSMVHELMGDADDSEENADLAEALNDGWEIVDMNHTSQIDPMQFNGVLRHFRLVTLKKLVDVKPEPDEGAKVSAETEETPPLTPPQSVGEGNETPTPADVFGPTFVPVNEAPGKVTYIMPGEINRGQRLPVSQVELDALTYERAVKEHIPLSGDEMKWLANRDLFNAVLDRAGQPVAVGD